MDLDRLRIHRLTLKIAQDKPSPQSSPMLSIMAAVPPRRDTATSAVATGPPPWITVLCACCTSRPRGKCSTRVSTSTVEAPNPTTSIFFLFSPGKYPWLRSLSWSIVVMESEDSVGDFDHFYGFSPCYNFHG